MKNKSIIITGPTATGKTSLATQLCRKVSGEIISADSRQVYRGLDIGTGKDLADYLEPAPVKYHMIDIREPMEGFSLFDWRSCCIEYDRLIRSVGNLPVICGGTPLYLDMLLNDYSMKGEKSNIQEESIKSFSLEELSSRLKKEYPEIAQKTDLTQKQRILRAFEIAKSDITAEHLPENEYLIIAPYWHRKIVHERIEFRLKERWAGLKQEASELIEQGVTHERMEWFGLEYRFMSRWITGQLSENEAFDLLLIKIRQFAKRQDIWFRKIEKSGFEIHWLEGSEKLPRAEELVNLFLNGEPLPQPELKISEITYGPRTQ